MLNNSFQHNVASYIVIATMTQVLNAVMEYSDRNGDERAEFIGKPVEVLHWDAAIDDSGEQLCL